MISALWIDSAFYFVGNNSIPGISTLSYELSSHWLRCYSFSVFRNWPRWSIQKDQTKDIHGIFAILESTPSESDAVMSSIAETKESLAVFGRGLLKILSKMGYQPIFPE